MMVKIKDLREWVEKLGDEVEVGIEYEDEWEKSASGIRFDEKENVLYIVE